jgi:hypothetical protein
VRVQSLLKTPGELVACRTKTPLFLFRQLFLCLSRACLGKGSILSRNWRAQHRKKDVCLHRSGGPSLCPHQSRSRTTARTATAVCKQNTSLSFHLNSSNVCPEPVLVKRCLRFSAETGASSFFAPRSIRLCERCEHDVVVKRRVAVVL